MGISVEDNGLMAFLTKRINIDKKIIDVVKTNGAEMQERAQGLAPVDTGFLRRDINLNIETEGKAISAVVSTDAEYASYQEYGTRYQPAQPHLRPAYYAQELKFKHEIERIAND